MTSVQKWEPGDVAVSMGDRLIRTSDGTWSSESGQSGIRYTTQEPRPLAVIDPESDEDMERLADLFCSAPSSGWVKQMRNALREFAAPTLPIEEPRGLGAVVETANGDLFVRSKTITTVAHRKPAKGGERRKWDHLRVVRVLSEGVQP